MTIDKDKLGWIVAAALGGVMATGALSGFQATPAPKFATVDMIRVYNDSPLANTNSDKLEDARKARFSVLDFINRNRAMDPNDSKKLADLSLKPSPSAAETAEIARLRAAGEAATGARTAAMTKTTPDDATRTALADFGTKDRANLGVIQTLQAQYEDELQKMTGDLREKTLARVREVVRGLAAKQGYTVVFDVTAAPYAANDLTEEAGKALKK